MMKVLKIEELKDNKFPKGLVPLEKIFDRHDMYKKEERGK
jgi:hypothetical protein